jgi:gas vesicle protein
MLNDNTMDYELIGALIALGGILISIWRIQRGNIERQKGMSDDINHTKLEIVRMKSDQAQTEKDLYNEISGLKNLHTTDVKELAGEIKNSYKETSEIEQRHHEEVMREIKTLAIELTAMCSTWDEYRSTHNGKAPAKRRTPKKE